MYSLRSIHTICSPDHVQVSVHSKSTPLGWYNIIVWLYLDWMDDKCGNSYQFTCNNILARPWVALKCGRAFIENPAITNRSRYNRLVSSPDSHHYFTTIDLSSSVSAKNCHFPSQWTGKWFQSGEKHYISINLTSIQNKGVCIENDGDKFLIEDK